MRGSRRSAGRGLPLARVLMVIGSFAPLFVLWALRGAFLPDRWWVPLCLTLAVAPNLILVWRWCMARRRNDHRVIVVGTARDQSEHLLVYLFAMLLPLYTANLTSTRELASVVVAFIFIVFLFWHMNLHYMNVAFALSGYHIYTVETRTRPGPVSVVLISRRHSQPLPGTSIDGFRLSDTVYVEKDIGDAG